MNKPLSVRLQVVPLHEKINSRQRKRQACLESSPGAVRDLFDMAHSGQHRQHRLHHHSGMPQAAVTELEVGRIPFFGMESPIAQDNHLAVESFTQGMKGGVRCVGTGTGPGHDQAKLVKEEAKFPPDNPAMVGFAFASDLLSPAACSHRMEQCNPIAIDHPQDRERGQELVRPGTLGRQEPKEAGPLGQRGNQVAPVAAHPPIKCPVPTPLRAKRRPKVTTSLATNWLAGVWLCLSSPHLLGRTTR